MKCDVAFCKLIWKIWLYDEYYLKMDDVLQVTSRRHYREDEERSEYSWTTV